MSGVGYQIAGVWSGSVGVNEILYTPSGYVTVEQTVGDEDVIGLAIRVLAKSADATRIKDMVAYYDVSEKWQKQCPHLKTIVKLADPAQAVLAGIA